MPLDLSPQVFAITARLVEDRAGLHYDLRDIDVLAEKLSDRATELGMQSLLDYYYYLRYDEGGPAELDRLVERLVVQETYFFREAGPLKLIVDEIVPELARERRPVRLWSAACATGEEAYTLAMMLEDAGHLASVELVASDISAKALAKARAGVYGSRSLRFLGAQRMPRQLLSDGHGGVRVHEDLARSIRWCRVNLLDERAVRELGPFDVVVCRNVLIYFSDCTVCRVAEHLGRALRPGGILLLGASESLLRFGTAFLCEERSGSFYYRTRPE
jgi:chemotaxis protein methyltransferase CheR